MSDNLAFVRTVELMGVRENAKHTDMSDVLPEEVPLPYLLTFLFLNILFKKNTRNRQEFF